MCEVVIIVLVSHLYQHEVVDGDKCFVDNMFSHFGYDKKEFIDWGSESEDYWRSYHQDDSNQVKESESDWSKTTPKTRVETSSEC